ncbi:sulfatase-like hydrolase/transferase [Paraburkholderia sp. J8-2]|uniref:sulfatase-like hydrolase/transferase n=1 Tax=Paraburkholderia sp. J8-2 TaxID=2805440 RepID=UPI002AB646E2|nr:sulfatase-like hydrolase/transferase [Paraburkholderia sp. J8-2]
MKKRPQKSDDSGIDTSSVDEPEVAGRRGFLRAAGLATAAFGVGVHVPTANAVDRSQSVPSTSRSMPRVAPSVPPPGYNILFILTDQERYFDKWPFPVPGRETLRREGITFTNHQIASCVCSPSRSVIYTGQHTQHTKINDNAGMPWQPDMSTDIRTVGHMLHDAGYYSAYLGKWHLGGDMRKTNSPYNAPVEAYNRTMAEYGFDDYFGVGDLVGAARGGYNYDGVTTELAVSWLRNHTAKLAAEKKNWFLAVNIVNPHDVMFLNTDPTGQQEQTNSQHLLHIAPVPNDATYYASWNQVPLAASRHQPYDEPGRPAAHGMFRTAMEHITGAFPFTDDRIRTYQNYYFNCVRDSDAHVVRLLETLAALGLRDNTIVVMTSDHGDHVGAHQLVGKGATAYAPQNHVPLVIRHPAYPGGTSCRALTSHLDIAPTLLGLTGADAATVTRLAGDAAHGRDFSDLLSRPQAAPIDAKRKVSLFNYAMLSNYDSEWMVQEFQTLSMKGASREVILKRMQDLQPDFRFRGAIRSVFDGRYRFSRYFSVLNFNEPVSLEALFEHNDVELYDTLNDPDEVRNLARDRKAHGELLLEMNSRLSTVIRDEVGDDSIASLPIRNGKVEILNANGSA